MPTASPVPRPPCRGDGIVKILFVAWRDTSHPLAGGSEVMIDKLAQGLHERGHDVALLAGGPTTEHDYRVIDGGGRFSQYLREPVSYHRHFRDRDLVVDVANGMAFFNPVWRRKPTICFVHHVHFGQWREWFNPAVAWFGSTVETRVTPYVYRNSLWVTVSPSTAGSLQQLGVHPEQIRIVPNGVELPPTAVPHSPEPLFVTMGRLVPHKRFDLLLRAWRRVQPVTGGRLLVAGEGPVRPELEELAGPGVELLGWIDEAEKERLLGESWLFLQPSRLEGWGLVVMEAAAHGTPTLGFWAPGTRDSVVDGETGLLVESEDELVQEWIRLAGDAELRAKLGAAARQRAEEYSWNRSVDLFEGFAREAIDGPRAFRRSTLLAGPADAGDGGLAARAGAAAPAGAGEDAAPGVDVVPSPAELHDPARYTKRELFRLFLDEKRDPEPFYERLAEKSIADFPYPVEGRRILDVGAGAGHYTKVLRRFGAVVAAVELEGEHLVGPDGPLVGGVSADAWHLPFPDASFDGIFCSNMLEHTPDVRPVFAELARVLRPGGWAWVSWTNWYSPWGGHEIVPLHLLGPDLGLRVWRRLFGEPRKNVPFAGLWPTHIGPTIRAAVHQPGLRLVGTYPRYYPSQRWITRVPGARELLTWNCVLELERVGGPGHHQAPPTAARRRSLPARAAGRLRRVAADQPALLPLVRRAAGSPTAGLSHETDLVVEGFPRSGATASQRVLRQLLPALSLPQAVHTPSQVKSAIARGVPVLVLVRDPVDTVAARLAADPDMGIAEVLDAYIHYHEALDALLDEITVVTYADARTDLAPALAAVDARAGTSFAAQVAATGRPVGVPGDGVDTTRLHQLCSRDEYAALAQEARTVFERLADRSVGRVASA